jgi:sensor histidine kinase YesM
MDSAAETLLIIVSSVLSVFLVVLIIAGIYFIKLLKQIRRLSDRAENVAESVESAAGAFEKAASPLAVLKIIGNIVEQTSRIRKRKD